MAQSPESTVFMLGAGFSRAISDAMPLTDDLGNECLRLLDRGEAPNQFSGGRFESYLSGLASDQPFLAAGENLRRRGLFEDFSVAIAEVLGNRQEMVLRSAPPPWLGEFIAVAHALRGTVITFNYDTLLECSTITEDSPLHRASAYEWAGLRFQSDSLSGGVPARIGGAAHGNSEAPTLRLLKLHGSMDWFWTPGDATGATVVRRGLPGTFTRPQAYTESDRRRNFPGRVPFIVPPTASKSGFYAVPLLHELWTEAFERLSGADRVVVLGYSLPATDTTTSNMVEGAIAASGSSVIIGDYRPQGVADRLAALGIDRARISTGQEEDENAISNVTRSIALDASADHLRDLIGDAAAQDEWLIVSWGDYLHAGVVSVERDGDDAVLRVEQPRPEIREVAKLRAYSDPDLRAVRDLADTSGGVYVEFRGHRQLIVESSHYSLEWGRAEGWRVLQVAGYCPISRDDLPSP